MLTRRTFRLAGLGLAAKAAVSGLSVKRAARQRENRDNNNPTKVPFEVTKTPEEWRRILTPEQFQVLREHGTERAGTSPLDKNYAAGTYDCAGCDLPLFSSEDQVQQRHRLAELLQAARQRDWQHRGQKKLLHDAHRGSLLVAAAAISAMYSRTARRRQDCATA